MEAFRAALAAGLAPSGQLSIWQNGRSLLEDRVGGELTFDLASLTKILSTSYLCARALQYGLLTLDDPIARFVPQAAPAVTVRQLLEHSGGYPAHLPFWQRAPKEEAHGWVVREAARTPLAYEPDTKIVYSDLGFILLGAALERVFAEPLSSLVTREQHGVFYRDARQGPLPHAHLTYAPTSHLPLSTGAEPEPAPPGLVHDPNARVMGGCAGHAGLFGTAEAVSRLVQRWLSASRGEDDAWLRRETVATMWTPSKVPGRARAWDKPSAQGSHTGDVWPEDTVGHLGFTGTSAWLSPSAGLSVVLVTNRGCTLAELKEHRRAIYKAAWEMFTPRA